MSFKGKRKTGDHGTAATKVVFWPNVQDSSHSAILAARLSVPAPCRQLEGQRAGTAAYPLVEYR